MADEMHQRCTHTLGKDEARLVLAYHEVVEGGNRYIYTVTTARLREHLESSRPSRTETRPTTTFDDGHASQFRHALPVLSACRTRATFFITAGWTGIKPQYMSVAQLKEVSQQGHAVQAHGWSHKLLTHCTPSELDAELRHPKERLEDLLAAEVDSISLPGGRWNRRVLSACVRAGYRHVYTSEIIESSLRYEGLEIHGRYMVKNTTTRADLDGLPASPATRHVVAYRLKRLCRRAIGDTAYQHLWRFLGSKQDCRQIDAAYTGSDEITV